VPGAAGFFFSNPHGGWEYPAFWIVAPLVQALLGDGAYALRMPGINAVGGNLSPARSV
jgi:putative oxidoreductase